MNLSHTAQAAALCAVALFTCVAATAGPAQARGLRGGVVAAGVIGGLALGAIAAQAAQPRVVYVVQKRNGRHHHCGCTRHHAH